MILLRFDVPLINELLVILILSVLFILILKKLKLPSVIGFLIAGALSGTNGLNLHDIILHLPTGISKILYINLPAYIAPPEEEVEILAEVGVALLLFTIGLEFSIDRLIRLRKAVFIGGGLQVIATILAFAGIAYVASYRYIPVAVFIGFLFALSSTAIVLKLLQESGDINRPYGQAILAILIFQDVAVVPMMLISPLMVSGDVSSIGGEIAILCLKLVGLLVAVSILAKYIMPYILHQIAKAKSKDLFIVSMLAICFAIAYLTSLVGLSFALGAFIAGLIITESRYGQQAVVSIMYFKELFTSIFFISVGLMLNVDFLRSTWHVIIPLTLLVIFVKGIIGAIAAIILKYPAKSVFGVAIGISQVGEFSFILAKQGEELGLMPIEIYQYFLAVSVFTMILSPILIHYINPLFEYLATGSLTPSPIKRWLGNLPKNSKSFNVASEALTEHIIILGHDLTSRTIAHGARKLNIPYVILELDPDIVDREAKKGEPIIYGDTSSEEILEHAGIKDARLLIMTSENIPEIEATLHAIRKSNPDIYIVARTKDILEGEKLKRIGANATVSDDLESNVAIVVEVLDYLDMPATDSNKFINYIKMDSLAQQGVVVPEQG